MLRYLLSIRYLLVLLLLSVSSELFSQVPFPHKDGERARYDVKIDIKKAYISGVCMMVMDEGIVKASIVNEFGLSAVDFTYNPTKDKVTYSDGTTEEVNGFDIPVPALDKEFDVALIGKKGKWYDHKVSVSLP